VLEVVDVVGVVADVEDGGAVVVEEVEADAVVVVYAGVLPLDVAR